MKECVRMRTRKRSKLEWGYLLCKKVSKKCVHFRKEDVIVLILWHWWNVLMCCVSWSVFGISITICNRFLMSLSGVSSVGEKMARKCFPAPGAMFLHVECLLANWNILKIWRQGACSPLWRHCACQQSTTPTNCLLSSHRRVKQTNSWTSHKYNCQQHSQHYSNSFIELSQNVNMRIFRFIEQSGL